jgi:hypothetical protein
LVADTSESEKKGIANHLFSVFHFKINQELDDWLIDIFQCSFDIPAWYYATKNPASCRIFPFSRATGNRIFSGDYSVAGVGSINFDFGNNI